MVKIFFIGFGATFKKCLMGYVPSRVLTPPTSCLRQVFMQISGSEAVYKLVVLHKVVVFPFNT